MLRGDEQGPIQSAVVMSDVAPEYAPQDRSLVSVSVSEDIKLDDPDRLDAALRPTLAAWFGSAANQWRRIRVYDIPYGVPECTAIGSQTLKPVDSNGNIFVCGDFLESPSIQGAMNSGLRIADQIFKPNP